MSHEYQEIKDGNDNSKHSTESNDSNGSNGNDGSISDVSTPSPSNTLNFDPDSNNNAGSPPSVTLKKLHQPPQSNSFNNQSANLVEATDGMDKCLAILGGNLAIPKAPGKTEKIVTGLNIGGASMFAITPLKMVWNAKKAHFNILGLAVAIPLGPMNKPIAIICAGSSFGLNAGVNAMTSERATKFLKGKKPYEQQAFAVKPMSGKRKAVVAFDSFASISPYFALVTLDVNLIAWIANAGLFAGALSLLVQALASQSLKHGPNPKIKLSDALLNQFITDPQKQQQELAYDLQVLHATEALFVDILKHARDQILSEKVEFLRLLFKPMLSVQEFKGIINEIAAKYEQSTLFKEYTHLDDNSAKHFLQACLTLNKDEFDIELLKGLLGKKVDAKKWSDSLPAFALIPPDLRTNFRQSLIHLQGFPQDKIKLLKKELRKCFNKGFNTHQTYNYLIQHPELKPYKALLKDILDLRRALMAVKLYVDDLRARNLLIGLAQLAFAANKPHLGAVVPKELNKFAHAGGLAAQIGFAPNAFVAFLTPLTLIPVVRNATGYDFLAYPLAPLAVILAMRCYAANKDLSYQFGYDSFLGIYEAWQVIIGNNKNYASFREYLEGNPAFYMRFQLARALVTFVAILALFTPLTGFSFALMVAASVGILDPYLNPIFEFILGYVGSTGNMFFNFVPSKSTIESLMVYVALRDIFCTTFAEVPADTAQATNTNTADQTQDPEVAEESMAVKREKVFYHKAASAVTDTVANELPDYRRFQAAALVLKEVSERNKGNLEIEAIIHGEEPEALMVAQNNNNISSPEQRIAYGTKKMLQSFVRLSPAVKDKPFAHYQKMEARISVALKEVYEHEEDERTNPKKGWVKTAIAYGKGCITVSTSSAETSDEKKPIRATVRQEYDTMSKFGTEKELEMEGPSDGWSCTIV